MFLLNPANSIVRYEWLPQIRLRQLPSWLPIMSGEHGWYYEFLLLGVKGKTYGDYLELKEVRVNCEQNSILYLVHPAGKGSCHTNDKKGEARSGCYYRRIHADGTLNFVEGQE